MAYEPSVNRPGSIPINFFQRDAQRRWVYVMRCYDDYVKVGLADEPKKRLAQVQLYNPLPVTLTFIRWVPATVAIFVEKRAHAALAAHRMHGEWFKVSPVVALKAIVEAIREGQKRADELRAHARAIMEDEARYRRDPNRKAEAIAHHHESIRSLGLDEETATA